MSARTVLSLPAPLIQVTETAEFPSESSQVRDYDFPMPRYLLALLATLTLLGLAQETNSAKASDHTALAAALAFEAEPVGGVPEGWGGGPAGTIFADDKVLHGG